MGAEKESGNCGRADLLRNGICPICGKKRLQEFGTGCWLCRECSAVIEEGAEENGYMGKRKGKDAEGRAGSGCVRDWER